MAGLEKGIVPSCLSMLVERKWDEILSRLEIDYPIMAWPTLPITVIDQLNEVPDVRLLGRKILQINLPTQIGLNPSTKPHLLQLVKDLRNALEIHV